jgi:thiol:disulfide interchange protein DsbC
VLRTVIAALLILPGLAFANEVLIRKALEPKLGGAKIEGIQQAPVAGLWEVRVRAKAGVEIYYTDAAATYIILGRIIDSRTGKDLTDDRLRKLNAIRFDSLPFEQAVKIQRGNGERVLVMFSDPYCPYCKQFEQTLQQVDNITVYVFMYPVIKPDLADHSRAVWCSPDRGKAWLDLAMRGKPSSASASCETPVEKNLELGHKLGVNSTPTLILANGERVAGGMAAADLQQLLDSAKR